PYNLLLGYLFPMDKQYMVVPQCKHHEQSKSIDFFIIFIVSHNECLVFFMEVNPFGHIEHISPREWADKQMRKRFKELRDIMEIPILYSMSALGTKVCFYQYDKQTSSISVKVIKNDGDLVIDTALIVHWSLDIIMTPEGERKLCEVVNHIKVMCTQL
ncbi:hypothetical protein L873DRAFT_1688386, partial [Choiromyces venosus 120613-1]